MDAFRLAVEEIGDVAAAQVSAHIEKQHGVKIEPAVIPIFKATLKDLKRTNKRRQGAKSILAE